MTFQSPWGFGIGLIVPVAILLVLAVLVPRAMSEWMSPTLRAVGLNFVLSSLVLTLAGAIIFALMYALQGAGVAAALASSPLGAVMQFIRLGVMAALIWGPVLLLVLFGLAQKTEP